MFAFERAATNRAERPFSSENREDSASSSKWLHEPASDRTWHFVALFKEVPAPPPSRTRIADRIGAVEPRKFADLDPVAGDALADISAMERVCFLMKGGEVVRNDF